MIRHVRKVAGFPYDPGIGLLGEFVTQAEEAGFEDCRLRCHLFAGRLLRLARAYEERRSVARREDGP